MIARRAVFSLAGTAFFTDKSFSQNLSLETAVSEETLDQAIARVTSGAAVQRGKVRIELPALVDNGNAVPITVSVDHPQTRGRHVRRIVLLNEKNPQREIAEFEFSPAIGQAEVSTRIRLATSQKIAAIAELSDGSFWMATAAVLVTLAACIDGDETL